MSTATIHFLSSSDEFEVDDVGVDQIGKGARIAFALLARVALELNDVFVDVFGFAPADRDVAVLEQEVGHAGVGLLRLVDHRECRIDAAEKRFQRWPIAMLGRLPAGEFRAHLFKIKLYVHAHPLIGTGKLAPEAQKGSLPPRGGGCSRFLGHGGGRDASASQETLSAADAAGPHLASPQGGGATGAMTTAMVDTSRLRNYLNLAW